MRAKILIEPTAIPDLLPALLEARETTPGVRTQVNVTVLNAGLNVAPASRLDVGFLHQGQLHPIARLEVPELGPLEGFVARTNCTTLGKVGDFPLRAVVDSLGRVAEGNEGNNADERVASVLVPRVQGIDLLDPA